MTGQRYICINNEGYPVSLEMFTTYDTIPDAAAAKREMIRVIDESGDDYLYPKSRFIPVNLPVYDVDPSTGREFREQA